MMVLPAGGRKGCGCDGAAWITGYAQVGAWFGNEARHLHGRPPAALAAQAQEPGVEPRPSRFVARGRAVWAATPAPAAGGLAARVAAASGGEAPAPAAET